MCAPFFSLPGAPPPHWAEHSCFTPPNSVLAGGVPLTLASLLESLHMREGGCLTKVDAWPREGGVGTWMSCGQSVCL